jgi:hypothetical protein
MGVYILPALSNALNQDEPLDVNATLEAIEIIEQVRYSQTSPPVTADGSKSPKSPDSTCHLSSIEFSTKEAYSNKFVTVNRFFMKP